MEHPESTSTNDAQGSLLGSSLSTTEDVLSPNVTSRRRVTSRSVVGSSPSTSAKTLSSITSQSSTGPVNPFYMHKLEQSINQSHDIVQSTSANAESHVGENAAPNNPFTAAEKIDKLPKPYLSDYLNKKYNIDSSARPSSMRLTSAVPASIDSRHISLDSEGSSSSFQEEKRRPVSMAVHRSSGLTSTSSASTISSTATLSRHSVTQNSTHAPILVHHSVASSMAHVEVPLEPIKSTTRRPLSMTLTSSVSRVFRGGNSSSSSSGASANDSVGSSEIAHRRPTSLALSGSRISSSSNAALDNKITPSSGVTHRLPDVVPPARLSHSSPGAGTKSVHTSPGILSSRPTSVRVSDSSATASSTGAPTSRPTAVTAVPLDDPVAAALASSITLRSRSKALISKMFPAKSPAAQKAIYGNTMAATAASSVPNTTVVSRTSVGDSRISLTEKLEALASKQYETLSSTSAISTPAPVPPLPSSALVTPAKASNFFTIHDVSDSDNDDLANEHILKHVDSDDIWDNSKYATASVMTPEHPTDGSSVTVAATGSPSTTGTLAIAELRSRASLPTPSTNARLLSRRSSTPRIETPTAEELDESNMPHDQQHHVANNLITKYIQLIADYSPSPLCEILLNSEPIITYFVIVFEIFFMLLWMFLQYLFGVLKRVYIALKPYKIHYLLPSFVGLVMCFFGAHFMTLIATIEAYRSIRYESTLESINALITDFNLVWEANKLDDAIVTVSTPVEESEGTSQGHPDSQNDDHHNHSSHHGHHLPPRSARKKLSRTSSQFRLEQRKSVAGTAPVPDVLQITSRELVARKTMLFLRTVEPHRFLDAVIGINTGFVAVIATLKVQFAKTITLGNAVSKPIEQVANIYALPILESFVPAEYRKWTKPLLSYGIKSSCISVAWMLRRMMSSYHSAIRGGLLFSKNLFNYLYSMKYISVSIEDTPLDKLVGYSLAALGIYFQVYFRFSLPFPLNILLFPFTVLEYFLVWCVNNSSYIVQSM